MKKFNHKQFLVSLTDDKLEHLYIKFNKYFVDLMKVYYFKEDEVYEIVEIKHIIYNRKVKNNILDFKVFKKLIVMNGYFASKVSSFIDYYDELKKLSITKEISK